MFAGSSGAGTPEEFATIFGAPARVKGTEIAAGVVYRPPARSYASAQT